MPRLLQEGVILTEIITAFIAFAGTLVGTLGGILAANRLTSYRIEQLEKKVERHNNVIERTGVIEEQIKVINHRIEDAEKDIKEITHHRRSGD